MPTSPATTTIRPVRERGWADAPAFDVTKVTLTAAASAEGTPELSAPTFVSAVVSLSSDAKTATVRITWSRPLSKDERLTLSLSAGWLEDSAGNRAAPYSGPVLYTATRGTIPDVSSVSVGGVTYNFSAPQVIRTTGTTVQVINAAGVTVSSITPAPGIDANGKSVGNAELDPVRSREQGFTEALDGPPEEPSDDGLYDPAFTASFPVVVPPGSTLVVAKHQGDPFAKVVTRPQATSRWSSISCVASEPADLNAVPASEVKGEAWTGGARTEHVVDFLAVAEATTTVSATSVDYPPFDTLWARASLIDGIIQGRSTLWDAETNVLYNIRNMVPFWSTDYNQDGYAQFVHALIGSAMIGTVLDAYTAAERALLLEQLYRTGQNVYAAFSESGQTITASGGVSQGMLGPICVYLHLSGQHAALLSLREDLLPAELSQTYLMTSALRTKFTTPQARGAGSFHLSTIKVLKSNTTAPHTSLSLGATQVTDLPTAELGVSGGGRFSYNGARIRRVSDDADLGTVSGVASPSGVFTVTNPSAVALTAGDEVYCQPNFTLVDGYPHWFIDANTDGDPDQPNNSPLPSTDYLNQQEIVKTWAALKLLGWFNPDWAFVSWGDRLRNPGAYTGGQTYPSSNLAFLSASGTPTTWTFGADFLSQHGAAASAVSPAAEYA